MIVRWAVGAVAFEERDILEGLRRVFSDGLPHDGLITEDGRSKGGLPNTLEGRVEELICNSE